MIYCGLSDFAVGSEARSVWIPTNLLDRLLHYVCRALQELLLKLRQLRLSRQHVAPRCVQFLPHSAQCLLLLAYLKIKSGLFEGKGALSRARARALCSKIWESATFLSNDSRDLP